MRMLAVQWFLLAVVVVLLIRVAYQVGLTEGSHTAFAVCQARPDSVITHPVRPARNP